MNIIIIINIQKLNQLMNITELLNDKTTREN